MKDQTYEELYRVVVPKILRERGRNVTQDDILRELMSVYNSIKKA